MNEVRELLERAVQDAGQPAIATEAVYARAARVRWRRRATVSAAALAVVVAGTAGLPQLSQEAPPRQSSVAAPAGPAGSNAGGDRLSALLPAGVGEVKRVSLAGLLKESPAPQRMKYLGPLDGEYSVSRDGGVGYITLSTESDDDLARKLGADFDPAADLCAGLDSGRPFRTFCMRDELADGRVLTIWNDANAAPEDGTPQWGIELVGRLTLKGGGVLAARSSTGYLGEHSQGPLLKIPPLGREELRELMLSPEVLAKN